VKSRNPVPLLPVAVRQHEPAAPFPPSLPPSVASCCGGSWGAFLGTSPTLCQRPLPPVPGIAARSACEPSAALVIAAGRGPKTQGQASKTPAAGFVQCLVSRCVVRAAELPFCGGVLPQHSAVCQVKDLSGWPMRDL